MEVIKSYRISLINGAATFALATFGKMTVGKNNFCGFSSVLKKSVKYR
jgi:hypothetical protein